MQIQKNNAIETRILTYNIAPSGVEPGQILPVSEFIFTKKFTDINALKLGLQTNVLNISDIPLPPAISRTLPTYTYIYICQYLLPNS